MVPRIVLPPQRVPDQSGPNHHELFFSRLLFVVMKTPPHMGFYYTTSTVVVRKGWVAGMSEIKCQSN